MTDKKAEIYYNECIEYFDYLINISICDIQNKLLTKQNLSTWDSFSLHVLYLYILSSKLIDDIFVKKEIDRLIQHLYDMINPCIEKRINIDSIIEKCKNIMQGLD